jgi:hypothetical protein
VFRQRLTYAVAGLTVLETSTALNILHHFAFVIEQGDNDFTASKTAETDEHNQRPQEQRVSDVAMTEKRIKPAEVCGESTTSDNKDDGGSSNTSMFC